MNTANLPDPPAATLTRRRGLWLPWLTLAVLATSALLDLSPETWQTDRAAAGEPWRWLTGQLVHWGPTHRLWDWLVLGLFGGWLERQARRRLLATLLLAGPLCAAAFAWLHPELATYRGTSGLGAACLAAVAMTLLRTRPVAGLILLVGLATKVLAESASGTPALSAEPFVTLPAVHLAGALAGVAVGVRRLRP